MATTLERIQYGYDPGSRRTWCRRALTTGEDYYYNYDGLSQVVSSNRGTLNLNCSAIAATPKHTENWDYDSMGNWHGYRVEQDGSVTLEQDRCHDKGNRLMQIEGATRSFELDCAGRMTLMAPKDGNWDSAQRITWDAWGRIKRIAGAEAGSAPTTYSYDGLNRRIMKDIDLDYTETYYSDAWRPLEERRNGVSTPYKQFLWGARHHDDLVRQDRDSIGGGGPLNEVRYVLMDYFSPAAVVNEAGAVTARYDFSAFGVRRTMAPDFSPGPAGDLNFAFQGQFLDDESGLLNYGYRYYSPHLGRWMCKDPIGIGGGLNLYSAFDNQATNLVDQLGLAPQGGEYSKTGEPLFDFEPDRIPRSITGEPLSYPEPEPAKYDFHYMIYIEVEIELKVNSADSKCNCDRTISGSGYGIKTATISTAAEEASIIASAKADAVKQAQIDAWRAINRSDPKVVQCCEAKSARISREKPQLTRSNEPPPVAGKPPNERPRRGGSGMEPGIPRRTSPRMPRPIRS
jgi:RHS repeat-associated protein